jgi:uncharacterized protein YukE
MKSRHPPALTPSAIVSTAGKKAQTVQRQLQTAEAELRASNAALEGASQTRASEGVETALKHNIAAEDAVHEATRELDTVAELLSHAETADAADEPSPPASAQAGKTGEGARSAIPHLRKVRGG